VLADLFQRLESGGLALGRPLTIEEAAKSLLDRGGREPAPAGPREIRDPAPAGEPEGHDPLFEADRERRR
jgi:hypothetical protein